MRLFYILLVTILINYVTIMSQTQWTIVNPSKAEYFKDVKVFGSQDAIAVGAKGTIYRTIDGGSTWSAHISPTSDNLNDVFFITPAKGWIVGGNSLLRTVDGGVTWLKVHTFASTVLGVHFLDANTGFVCGAFGNIFKTTDGGITWAGKASGLQFGWLSAIVFTDNLHGYAVGSNKSYASTTDGGENWTLIEDNSGFGRWNQSIFFIDNNNGWIVGGDDPLVTTDGGVNWTTTSAITRNDFLGQVMHEVFFTDANNGMIVGVGGELARTSDGGSTWTVTILNTEDTYYSFRIDPTTSTGWMVGFGGLIMKTTDKGANWTYDNKAITINDLTNVYGKFPQDVWATGNNGTFIHSTDAGATWSKVNLGTTNQLTNVLFPGNGNVGYAFADGFQVYYTTDGGNNWSLRYSGSRTPLGVDFTDVAHGWACGDFNGGYIASTQDSGKNWTMNTAVSGLSNLGTLSDIEVVSSGQTIVAVGGGFSSPTIIRSTDGGASFNIIKDGNTAPFDMPVNSVFFIDDNTGWVCGENGLIAKSTDGGVTWNTITLNTTESLTDIKFNNSVDGWVVGSTGTSLVSHDGGDTWLKETSFTNSSLSSVSFVNGNELVRVGQSGTIHKGLYQPLVNSVDITFKVNLNGAKDVRNNLPITNIIFVGLRGNTSFLGNWLDGGNWTPSDTVGLAHMKILYNDGTHGDEVAGDSIWSLKINIPTTFTGSAYNGIQGLSYEYKFGVWYTGTDTVNNGVAPMDNEMLQGVNHTFTMQSGAVIIQNHKFGVKDVITVVERSNSTIPKGYILSQNYPNPFNPSTVINYSIPSPGKVKLIVYDVIGRKIKTLVDEAQPAGNYRATFDATKLSSGVYFYRIIINNFISTKKMLLLK